MCVHYENKSGTSNTVVWFTGGSACLLCQGNPKPPIGCWLPELPGTRFAEPNRFESNIRCSLVEICAGLRFSAAPLLLLLLLPLLPLPSRGSVELREMALNMRKRVTIWEEVEVAVLPLTPLPVVATDLTDACMAKSHFELKSLHSIPCHIYRSTDWLTLTLRWQSNREIYQLYHIVYVRIIHGIWSPLYIVYVQFCQEN